MYTFLRQHSINQKSYDKITTKNQLAKLIAMIIQVKITQKSVKYLTKITRTHKEAPKLQEYNLPTLYSK